jgi:DNA polymerase-4
MHVAKFDPRELRVSVGLAGDGHLRLAARRALHFFLQAVTTIIRVTVSNSTTNKSASVDLMPPGAVFELRLAKEVYEADWRFLSRASARSIYNTERMILHVDLDAFFASVEVRDDPQLRGKPVLVGMASGRSVVLAASYEARPFGCRSAMPMATARRLCPQAVVVPPRAAVYAEVSKVFRQILSDYTPLVEPVSIDEAFLDVKGSARLFPSARHIATEIRRRIRDELDLTASVGGAPVKFAAKIASDLAKPDGLRLVEEHELHAFLEPLPIERLFGVGQKTAAQLRALGLHTVGQVARYPLGLLRQRLGVVGASIEALARGVDPRPVEPDRDPVSIGAEETFERDLIDGPELRRHVTEQAERVAKRLRSQGLLARVVVLKLKWPDFHLTTRRRTLEAATSDGRVLVPVAVSLLADERVGWPGVRLSGVQATALSSTEAPRQLTFEDGARRRSAKLAHTLDAIQSRFGAQALGRADLILDENEDDEG